MIRVLLALAIFFGAWTISARLASTPSAIAAMCQSMQEVSLNHRSAAHPEGYPDIQLQGADSVTIGLTLALLLVSGVILCNVALVTIVALALMP